MLKVDFKKKLSLFNLKINFSISQGEYVVILGRTGAGKSMTAKIIAGIEKLDYGKILLRGKEITHLPPEKRQISYLPQGKSLFPNMTVLQNLEFPFRVRGLKPDKIKIEEISQKFGITELLERNSSDISGGEAQRVGVARAILSDPEVIILDEPFSSLDFLTKVELIEFMRKIKGNRTIMHITHDPLEAQKLADRVFLMEKGEITFSGSWKDFLKKGKGKLPNAIRSFFFLDNNSNIRFLK